MTDLVPYEPLGGRAPVRLLQRWDAHPKWALALRVLLAVFPALVAFFVMRIALAVLPPDEAPIPPLPWFAGVALVGVALAVAAERVARRFLPLVAFLRLSMAFPDQAPSRFAVAMRTGTTRQLERRIEEIRSVGLVGIPEEQYGSMVLELAAALSVHDRLTRGHGERVRAYTDLIGQEMGLPEDDMEKLRWASLLHDVGKLFVPSEILNKPGKLTAEEFDIIKRHPLDGLRLVAPLQDWLGPWVLAVGQHHERWDGGGYPFGLASTDIHLGARMVAVADAFDVMTSARSYKAPMKVSEARAELTRCAGRQFDPVVVRAFLSVGLGRMHHFSGPIGVLMNLGALGGSQILPQAAPMVSSLVAASAMTMVGLPPALDEYRVTDRPSALAYADDATIDGGATLLDPVTTVVTVDPPIVAPSAAPTSTPGGGRADNGSDADGGSGAGGSAPDEAASSTTSSGPGSTTSTSTPRTGSGASTPTTVPPETRSGGGQPPAGSPTNLPVTGAIIVDEDGEGAWRVTGTGSAPAVELIGAPTNGESSVQTGMSALDDVPSGSPDLAAQSTRWSVVVTYRPVAEFNGTDTVVVRSCRGYACVTTTVSVTVSSRNDAPAVEARDVTRSVCGRLTPSELIAGGRDADGDPLSLVSVRRADGQPAAITNLGTLGLGTETLTVTVADAAGAQASGPVTVMVSAAEAVWAGMVPTGAGPTIPSCAPAIASVTWHLDGDEVGTTSTAEFDLRSATDDWNGLLDDLVDRGDHTLTAELHLIDGSTTELVHSFSVASGNSGNGNSGSGSGTSTSTSGTGGGGSGNSGSGNSGNGTSGSGHGGNSGSNGLASGTVGGGGAGSGNNAVGNGVSDDD